MLNLCPKCRSFYSDAALRFCLKDGVPLIAASGNENLRREGEDFIRRTEQRVRRETFRKQIVKIVSIMITTILTILVISVLTINSWLYLNPETVETAKNETIQPEPQPSIQVSPEPEPSGETATESVSPNGEPSPTLEISPTPIPKTEVIKTPTPIRTPPITSAPVSPPIPIEPPVSPPIPPPEICTQEEKSRADSFIKNRYVEIWRKDILIQKEPLQSEIASANNLSFDQISVKLNFSPERISVLVSPDCQKATVNIQVLWTVQANAPNVKIRVLPPRRNSVLPYRCEKTGSIWNCK